MSDADVPNEHHDAPDRGLVGPEHLHAMLPFLGEAVYLYDRDGDLKARLSPPNGILG